MTKAEKIAASISGAEFLELIKACKRDGKIITVVEYPAPGLFLPTVVDPRSPDAGAPGQLDLIPDDRPTPQPHHPPTHPDLPQNQKPKK